ncbi:MAG TPA: 50S ribosomal protein L24, partial [Candidatus Goldiibacteriota bacterium]|nr:50S ribosomal protein L24 [Candidatus Goldiibacteriota bacterium]
KNDIVTIIRGKDKGASGKVLKVFTDENKLIVEKVNFVKKHTRPSKKVQQGGILEKEAPIDASKVMLICNKCGKKTKIKMSRLADGKRVRVCKKCSEMIDEK